MAYMWFLLSSQCLTAISANSARTSHDLQLFDDKNSFGKILYFLSDFPKKSDLCLSLTVFEFFLQMLHADQYTVRIYYDVKLVSEKYYDGNREFGRVRHSIVSSISQQFCLLRRDFCIYA